MEANDTATKEQVYVNTSVRTIGSIGVLGIQLAAMVVLSRLLPPATFGMMTYAMILIGFADLASQLGVGPALVQKPKLTDREIRAGFTISFCFGLAVACLLVIAAPVLVEDVTAVKTLRALAIMFLFMGVSVVSSSLLQRQHRFVELVVIECATYFIGYFVVSVGLALAGFGVWSLVIGVLVNVGLRSVAYWSRIPHSLKFLFSWNEMRSLMRFGLLFTFTRVLNYTANSGDAFLVGRLMGDGPLGLYSRAFLLVRLPAQLVTRSMHSVLFPVLSRIQDNAVASRTYYQSTMFALCLMAPLTCTVVLTAPELVVIPFGQAWSGAVLPLQILAPVAVFSVFTLGDALLKSTGRLGLQLLVHVSFCAVLFLAVLSLYRPYGIAGVAAGVLIANALMYCLMSVICARELRSSTADVIKCHAPALTIVVMVLSVGLPVRLLTVANTGPWCVWISTSVACCLAFAVASFVPICGPLATYQLMLSQYLSVMDAKTGKVRSGFGRRIGWASSFGRKP